MSDSDSIHSDTPRELNEGDPPGGSKPPGETVDAPAAVPAAASGDPSELSAEDHTVISSRPPIDVHHEYHGLHNVEFCKTLEGDRLDHFRLERFIGGGGMGAVFRGLDTELNRTVAVKILVAEQSVDKDNLLRFKIEAQSAARLDHENIARVYYVGQDQGLHYIVFEFIDGTNVRDHVNQNGPLPLAEAINITLQIALALAHASRRDVVHRDIKPSNVIITREGRAKLVDMGLARLHQAENSQQDLTASGVTLGTFDYISPEQARDPRSADVRSDLYSLGCTFFFMLTGQPPFPEGTVLQKLLQHQGDDAPDPHEFRPELPDDVSLVAKKLLAKSPSSRYQDAEELVAELLLLADRMGLPTTTSSSTVWVAPGTDSGSFLTRHLPWIASTVLLVASIVLLDQFWFSRGGPDLGLSNLSRDRDRSVPSNRGRSENFQQETGPRRSDATVSATTAGEERGPSSAGVERSGDPTGGQPTNRSITNDADQGLRLTNPMRRRLNSSASGQGLREQASSTSASVAAPDGHGLAVSGNGSTAGISAAELLRSVGSSDHASSERLPDQMGTIVVAPDMDAAVERAYRTLRAAVSAASNGDVIELRYNGRREEEPFKLVNKRLTIRAGKGYSPRVVFRPDPDEVDPAQHPRSMLTVLGGDLALVNVHLELEVPRDSATESLALIETRGAESVRLVRCLLTIQNTALVEGVAFFNIKAAADSDLPMIDREEIAEKPVEIRLENCIARGAANFLHSGELQPVDLFWKNGLLVTPLHALALHSRSTLPQANPTVQVDLQYLTAVAGRGLLLASYSADAHPTSVDITCKDSIVMADEDAALVELHGVDPLTRIKDSVVWQGDRNCYEGFRVFWLLRLELDDVSQQMDFADWQDHWDSLKNGHENFPRLHSVVWKRPPSRDIPAHEQAVDAYLLDQQASENPARGGASDGGDVGFRFDEWSGEAGQRSISIPRARAADNRN